MPKEKICKILDLHSVPWFERDGQVFADSMDAYTELFESVVNVTSWSKAKLYAWLGY